MYTIPFACIFISFFIAYIGRNRKLGFWGYFFASLLLTPVIGILLVIVSDKVKLESDYDNTETAKEVKK